MCMMESCLFRKNYKKITWEKKGGGVVLTIFSWREGFLTKM